jgi:DNA repair protein RadD
MMQLRDYQQAAVASVWAFLDARADNPCVVLPTGAGKTPVIADMVRQACEWELRTLVVSHVKELLEQSARTLMQLMPGADCGVISAGLGRKQFGHQITIAGVQSIYRHADNLGVVDLVIIDEAHLIPESGDGMYRQLLVDLKVINPQVRCVGLTATPYRLTSGVICKPGNVLNEVCYDADVSTLIDAGWLSPLRSKSGKASPDLGGVHIRGGEYIERELQAAYDDDELIEKACRELLEQCDGRSSILCFTAGVEHGRKVHRAIVEMDTDRWLFVDGSTASAERARAVERFRSGAVRGLVNVNVYTTGFDAPNVDCVALMRATLSPGLYSQMVGRGLRKAPSKADCLVLDYGGNILRHGPIDNVKAPTKSPGNREKGEAIQKVCPGCDEIIPAAATMCPVCGHEFPRAVKHDEEASTEPILSKQRRPDVTLLVDRVSYSRHLKRGSADDAPATLRVTYFGNDLNRAAIDEFVCIEHDGFAKSKARLWWAKRSDRVMPRTVADALAEIKQHGLREPVKVTARHEPASGYYRVAEFEWNREALSTIDRVKELFGAEVVG